MEMRVSDLKKGMKFFFLEDQGFELGVALIVERNSPTAKIMDYRMLTDPPNFARLWFYECPEENKKVRIL